MCNLGSLDFSRNNGSERAGTSSLWGPIQDHMNRIQKQNLSKLNFSKMKSKTKAFTIFLWCDVKTKFQNLSDAGDGVLKRRREGNKDEKLKVKFARVVLLLCPGVHVQCFLVSIFLI